MPQTPSGAERRATIRVVDLQDNEAPVVADPSPQRDIDTAILQLEKHVTISEMATGGTGRCACVHERFASCARALSAC